MYNLEIEEYHTYYVSEAEVLVHNTGGCKGTNTGVDGVKTTGSTAGETANYSSLDDGLNFSNKVSQHMGESSRQVPMQILQDAIRYGKAMPDPRGSSATMYYTTMYKNGKMYNLEVLYDVSKNIVYHFEYARKAMGNLPAIK